MLFVCGKGETGALGNGKTDDIALFEKLPRLSTIEEPIQVQAGADHTAVLTDLGNVYCFGDNTYGQVCILELGQQ